MEFFLCYNHADRVLAGQIKAKLVAGGHHGFLAHEDIDVPREWRPEIRKNLDSCSALIAIVTANFSASAYANQEAGIVMGKRKPVISLKFGAELPGFLESYQAIPASADSLDEAVEEAIEAGLVSEQSTTQPAPVVSIALTMSLQRSYLTRLNASGTQLNEVKLRTFRRPSKESLNSYRQLGKRSLWRPYAIFRLETRSRVASSGIQEPGFFEAQTLHRATSIGQIHSA